jgi:hypothetical protein
LLHRLFSFATEEQLYTIKCKIMVTAYSKVLPQHSLARTEENYKRSETDCKYPGGDFNWAISKYRLHTLQIGLTCLEIFL